MLKQCTFEDFGCLLSIYSAPVTDVAGASDAAAPALSLALGATASVCAASAGPTASSLLKAEVFTNAFLPPPFFPMSEYAVWCARWPSCSHDRPRNVRF